MEYFYSRKKNNTLFASNFKSGAKRVFSFLGLPIILVYFSLFLGGLMQVSAATITVTDYVLNWSSIIPQPTATDDVVWAPGTANTEGTFTIDVTNAVCKNLTLNRSGRACSLVISGTNTLTVNGDLMTNPGTSGSYLLNVMVGSGTLEVKGNATIASGGGSGRYTTMSSSANGTIIFGGNVSVPDYARFISPLGTVIYNGAGAQTIVGENTSGTVRVAATTYGNLIVCGGNKTIAKGVALSTSGTLKTEDCTIITTNTPGLTCVPTSGICGSATNCTLFTGSNGTKTVTVGDADFHITGVTTNNTGVPTYTSSNTAVATIVAGKIHAVAPGTSIITLTYPETAGVCNGSVNYTLTVSAASGTSLCNGSEAFEEISAIAGTLTPSTGSWTLSGSDNAISDAHTGLVGILVYRNNSITTPALQNPTQVSFWFKRPSTNTGDSNGGTDNFQIRIGENVITTGVTINGSAATADANSRFAYNSRDIWVQVVVPIPSELSTSATYVTIAGGTRSDNKSGFVIDDFSANCSTGTCTTATTSFALPSVTKTVGDLAFTNILTTNNTSTQTWTSSSPSVATVDASGQVTILTAGTTTIRVQQPADGTRCAVDINYLLTVNASGVTPLAAPTGLNETGICATEATLNWNAVTDAESYKVYVEKCTTGSGASAPLPYSNWTSLGSNTTGSVKSDTGNGITIAITTSGINTTSSSAYIELGNNAPAAITITSTSADIANIEFTYAKNNTSNTTYPVTTYYSSSNVNLGTGNFPAATNIYVTNNDDCPAGTRVITVSRQAGNTLRISNINITLAGSSGGTTCTAITGSPFTLTLPNISKALTGLTANSDYRYKVEAIRGNGTGTGNSAESSWKNFSTNGIACGEPCTTPIITNANTVNLSTNTFALTATPLGGSWEVSNGTGSATVSGSTLSLLSAGTVTVTYTVGACVETQVITIIDDVGPCDNITTTWPFTADYAPVAGTNKNITGGNAIVGSSLGSTVFNNSQLRLKSATSWPADYNSAYGLDIPFVISTGKMALINSFSITINSSSGTAATYYKMQYSIDGGDTFIDVAEVPHANSALAFTPAIPIEMSASGSPLEVIVRFMPKGGSTSSRNLNVTSFVIDGKTCEAPCYISPIVAVTKLDYVEGEIPNAQSFTLTYDRLPEDKTITITPPANFEILVPSGTPNTWSSLPVTYIASTASGSSVVQVRLISTLAASDTPYSGNISITTSKDCSTTVAVSGVVFPVGTCFMMMPDEVSGLDYEEGGTSPEKEIIISWKNLASDILVVRPPDNFEISVNDSEWTSVEVNYPVETDDQSQGSVPVKVRLLKGLSRSSNTGSLIATAQGTECTNSTILNGVVTPSIVLPVECGEDATTITTNWALISNNNSSTEITDNIMGDAVVLGANVKESAGNNSDGTRLKSSGSWPAAATEGYHLDIPFSVLEGMNATLKSITCTIKTSSGTAATSYLLQYSIDGGSFQDFDTQRGPTSSGSAVQTTFTASTPVLLGSGQRIVFRLLPIGASSNSRNIYIKNITIGGTTCDETRVPAVLEVDKVSLADFTSDGCNNSVQSFTVTGSDLHPAAGTIKLTGAADYEYSLVADFSSTITEVPYSGGIIDRLIYVRLKQGKPSGAYNQTLTVSGGGYKGEALNIALSGSSTSNTTLSFAGALTGFTYVDTAGGPSVSQQGTLSWLNIPAGTTVDLSMQHTNFEYSLDGISYSNPASFTTVASPQTIYFRLKEGFEVGNYADTLIAKYDCYTAKQILHGVVVSGTGCLFTASTYSISGLNYALSAGPSEMQTLEITIANYAATNSPTITLSNTNFEYSFNGTNWSSSSSTTKSELKITDGIVTMYVRLKSGLSAGTKTGTLTIKPNNCGEISIDLSGAVYEIPVILLKDANGREIGMVCEDAMSGNPTITLTADKTSTGPWIWEYNNNNEGWVELPQNSKTISLSPLNGITVFRVTVNGIVSVEKVFRTMVCCSVVGNSQLIFTNDFGTITGSNRASSSYVTDSYTYSASGEIKDGQYALVNNGNANSYWKDISDHTGNTNGAMLVFNGSAPGQVAYKRTYEDVLCPNTLYNFSAYVLNLHKSTDTNRPNLTFKILDPQENVLASMSTGDIAIADGWIESGVTFNSGDGGQTVTLEIVSSKPAGGGNDFAIDDVSFTSCTPETYLTVDGLKAIDYVLCEGDRELKMVSNCDYDIQAFYPDASYGFLYRKKTATDTGSDLSFRDWVLADWPQLDNEYIFDTSVLDEGETYSFMSITANSSTVVQKVVDYYTGTVAVLSLTGCEKYSASTVSKVRKPDIPDIEVQMEQDTACIKDGGTISASIKQLNEASPVVLSEGRFEVDKEGLSITTSTNLSFVVDVAASEPGIYEVSYLLPPDAGDTEQNVCDEFSFRHTIVILDEIIPEVSIETDKTTICINTGGAEFTATPTNGGENPSYQWYLNGEAVENSNSSTYLNTAIADGDQVYCVITNTDLCGSAGTSNTITITVENPTLEITSEDGFTLSCILNSVTLTATPSIVGGTFVWQPGSTTGISKTVNATGNYSVTYTTENNCTATSGVEVDYYNYPEPALIITNPEQECEPNTIDITEESVTEGSTNTGILSYWKDATTTDEQLTNEQAKAIAESGTYYIKTSPNACNVTDSKPVVVTINPKPVTTSIACD